MVSLWKSKGPKSNTEILIAGAIIVLVLSIIGLIFCCLYFRKDKRKKKAAKSVIIENAKIGHKLTTKEAEALYDLNESWERFSKSALNNSTKVPRIGRSSHAFQCVDYFRLQKWSKQLRDAEESPDEKDLHKVIKRLANEMEGHSEMFQLKPDTKKQLREIAQLPSRVITFYNASPV